jgi:carboxymethylenebutenolidase
MLIISAVLVAQPKETKSRKSGMKTMMVQYQSGEDTVSGFLALPEGKGPFPALIVIHEWWGLNDWVKDNAKMFAEKGYAALAIDLYRGRVATGADEAHELSRGLPEDRAARDLQAAAAYLKSRSDVKGDRIGSIGWCMGGGYSLQTALNVPDLAACVINYGRLVTDTTLVAKIPCPILGIFGEDDRGIPAESVKKFRALCEKMGKEIKVRIFPGAGHAFINENNKQGYRPKAAHEAWEMTFAFFETMLKR